MDIKKIYGRDIDSCRSCSNYNQNFNKCEKDVKDFSNNTDYSICSKWVINKNIFNRGEEENVQC